VAESCGGGIAAQREYREEGEAVRHPVEEVRPLNVPTPDPEGLEEFEESLNDD